MSSLAISLCAYGLVLVPSWLVPALNTFPPMVEHIFNVQVKGWSDLFVLNCLDNCISRGDNLTEVVLSKLMLGLLAVVALSFIHETLMDHISSCMFHSFNAASHGFTAARDSIGYDMGTCATCTRTLTQLNTSQHLESQCADL